MCLFGVGVGKGRIGQRSPVFQGLEILVIGAVTAVVGIVLCARTGTEDANFTVHIREGFEILHRALHVEAFCRLT